MFLFTKRFYRIAHSDEIYEASHSAKELINIFKRRDIEAIFQKSFRVNISFNIRQIDVYFVLKCQI